MNEAAVRRRMANDDCSAKEIDDAIASMADEYRDRRRDDQLEADLERKQCRPAS